MPKYYKYTEAIGKEICDAIATTTQGIEVLCKKNPHWPSHKLIKKWRWEKPLSFGAMYARAKQAQVDLHVERMFILTKDKKRGYLRNDEGKITGIDHAYLIKMRCEIDTIKWLAAKLAPRLYGEGNKIKESDNDAISTFRVENEQS